jgi:hypothetical protein
MVAVFTFPVVDKFFSFSFGLGIKAKLVVGSGGKTADLGSGVGGVGRTAVTWVGSGE